MKKARKKVLRISIILSLLCGSPFMAMAATDAITNQSEADSKINNDLQTGDKTYDVGRDTDDVAAFSQVLPQESLTIGGNTNGDHSLTMRADIAPFPTGLDFYDTNVRVNGSHEVTFQNLQSLHLDITGNINRGAYWSSNLRAEDGGSITVNDSVKEFTSENHIDPADPGRYRAHNLYAGSHSTIRVYAPKVNIINHGKSDLVVAGGYRGAIDSNIYLGDENHILDRISLKDTDDPYNNIDYKNGLFSYTFAMGTGTSAHIYAYANTIDASGLNSLGKTNGENSLVQLGSESHPVNRIHIEDCYYGFIGMARGETEVHADTIDITRTYDAIHAFDHGRVDVKARDFIVEDNVREQGTSIGVLDGTATLHTSHQAVLSPGADPEHHVVIGNNHGEIDVNTDPGDGATKVTGVIRASYGGVNRVDFHTNDSTFYGNVFDDHYGSPAGSTTITLSNGAHWTIDTSKDLSGLKTHVDRLNISNGIVSLQGKGTETGYRTDRSRIQVDHLAGNGGTFEFRTNLQQSADTRTVDNHSDQMIISSGGTSEGVHNIMIYDHSGTLGPLGAPAQGGYVLLVRDQSASPRAVFRGHADLQNGGLYAHPVEITNRPPVPELGYTDVPEDGMNWYVHMTNESSVPAPVIPTPNAENNTTFSRFRYGALWIEQETLRQRLGELRDHKQDDGIWARITRGEYTMNGVSGNADYTMYHIGYDKQIGNQKGHKRYIGMAYHHTDTDLNYRHFTDDSDMDADIGTIYYTNLEDKGHYLDIVGKFGRMKGKMKTFGEFPESAKWDSSFYSLSAEYGRKINYDNGWYWEPQAQLTYSHLGGDSYLTSQGTHAHLDNINSLIFRTGFTVGKKNGRNEYYGKVFWRHEFEGQEDVHFLDKNDDRLHDSYDFGSSWVTAGLGGQVGLSKDAYLYGDVEKSFGGDVKKKWQWNVGVRFGF